MKGKKCLKLLGLSLCAVFSWVLISCFSTSNVSAASLSTASFDLHYFTNNSGNYSWRNNILYGRNYGTSIKYGAINRYQFNTPSITSEGSSAVIHFETNIVASTDDIQYVFGYFTNLNYQNITSCAWNGVSKTIKAQSLNHALTEWTQDINGVTYYNVTLTFYGDVALDGIPANNSGVLTCAVGSNDYALYTNDTDNPDLIYFEQNPMTIDWSNNINDLLLQTQINQNNTIINNQNELNDWLKDDTPPSADTSIISGASGWLPQGPVDSLLTLPMTFAQGIVDIFTGQHQCSPIVLPFDFINSSITIPCLDSFFTMSGVNLIWNGVGTIISAFVLYETFKWLYKFVDDTLTFRENNSGLWGGL